MIADTNALSALSRGERDAHAVLSEATLLAIPVIALGEYQFGIMQSRYRSEHEQWLTRLLSTSKVLRIDAETAMYYAEIRLELKLAGTPIPSNDLWIAALSRQHGLPVLSRDGHFDRVKGLHRKSW